MRLLVSLSVLLASSCLASAQAPEVVRVQVDTPTKLKPGAPVRGHTVEPLYQGNRLLIPAGTPVEGQVAQVTPASRKRRLDAKSRGDFTPLHEAKIRFDRVLPAGVAPVPINTALADQGAAVVVFHGSGAKKESKFHRLWSLAIGKKNQAVGTFTAPGKGYRLKKMLYAQLPWHPESLEPGSQYDITLLDPPAPLTPTTQSAAGSDQKKLDHSAVLHARLVSDLTSASAKPGDPVTAVVTEPKLDAANRVQIPQGTLLEGNVLQAEPAGKWGHNGALRFTFHKMELPKGPGQAAGSEQLVTAVPSAVAGAAGANIQLDNEGGAKPQSNRTLLMPLTLGLLATSALTEDEATVSHAATSSNGFGLIGRIVAISAGSNVMGGTLGAVATGRSVYTHFLAHGKDVVFPHNTEIQVDLGPAKQPMASPTQH